MAREVCYSKKKDFRSFQSKVSVWVAICFQSHPYINHRTLIIEEIFDEDIREVYSGRFSLEMQWR